MPGGDGTGPMGMGAMTGRAAGYCAGFGTPGFANPIPGRGVWGRGRGGGGWGRRNWFNATGLPGWMRAGYGYPAWGAASAVTPATGYGYPVGGGMYPYGGAPAQFTKEQETDNLRSQAEYFEETLRGIKQRLSELEAEQEKN